MTTIRHIALGLLLLAGGPARATSPVASLDADGATFEDLDATAPPRRKPIVPPMRVESRVVVRELTVPGLLLEVSFQTWRSRWFTLEAGVSGTAGHGLGLTGPWRTMGNVDGILDFDTEIGPFLSTGPSGGVSVRIFRQQRSDVGTAVVPVAGWRVNATFLRSKRIGLAFTAKAMGDLRPVDLVNDQAEVVRLPRIEGQVGLRVAFGHGRLP